MKLPRRLRGYRRRRHSDVALDLPRVAPLSALAGRTADLVLVPTPALASAASAVCDSPVMTPEAAIGADAVAPDLLLSQVGRAIDAPWRTVDAAIDRRLTAWRYEADPTPGDTAIVDAAVASLLKHHQTVERALDRATPLEGEIVLLDEPGFDSLQRSVIPAGAAAVDPAIDHATETIDLEVYPHPGHAVDAAVVTIQQHDPDDVAIITDPDGPYWDDIAGALAAHGMPIGGQMPALDPDWSAFLCLLSLPDAPPPVTAGRAEPVLAALDVTIPDANAPLGDVPGEDASWVRAIADHGRTLSVGELLEQYQFRTDRPHQDLGDAVQRAGLQQSPIGQDIAAKLRAVAAARQPGQSEAGVIITDPRSGLPPDRSVLISLGLGALSVPRPPIDAGLMWDDVYRHRLARRLDLVSGHTAIAASPEPIEAFAAERDWIEPTAGEILSPEYATATVSPSKRPRAHQPNLTQSRLNRFANSPRDALFADVLDADGTPAQARGTSVHEYAEILLAAPAGLEAVGQDRLREAIIEDLLRRAPVYRRGPLRGRVMAALDVIEAYLAAIEVSEPELEAFHSPIWLDNTLADRFGLTIDSGRTEQYFHDETLGISGVVDLIVSPTHLVDFKTGRPRSPAELVRDALPGVADMPRDVQVALYLTALRRHHESSDLQLTFVYCYGGLAGTLRGQPPLAHLTRTVSYRPRSAAHDARRAETRQSLREDVPADHPRARVLESIPEESWSAFVDELDWTRDSEDIAGSFDPSAYSLEDIDQDTLAAGSRAIGVGLRDRHEQALYRDDLDAFEQLLVEWDERRQQYDDRGHPLGDPDPRRLAFPRLHADLEPVRNGGRSQ